MCALPTRRTPNLTSYSIFSPTANGTLACLTLDVDMTCARTAKGPDVHNAKAAMPRIEDFTPRLRKRKRELAPAD